MVHVMSEVKRFISSVHLPGMFPNKKGDYVRFLSFERMKKDRDAQRLRADTAEALSVTNILMDVIPGEDGMGEEIYAKSVAEVQLLIGNLYLDAETAGEKLAVAEQRIVELEADKSRLDFWQSVPQYAGGFAPSGEWSFFSSRMKTCYGKDLRAALDQLQVMHAALSPNPEVESHE